MITLPDLSDERLQRGFSALLKGADAPIGWKIGVNGAAMQARLGISGPVLGYLSEKSLRLSPADLGADKFHLVEAELALRVSRDVRGGASLDDCAAALEACAPAIEIVTIDGPLNDIEAMLAGNIFHAGVAIGPWTTTIPPMSALSLDLSVGDTAYTLDPSAIIGEPAEVVRFTADVLAQCGRTLQAGQIIICGSLNGPARWTPGAQVRSALSPLGEVLFG